MVYDQLWSEMLEIMPWLLIANETISAGNITSPGYISVADGGALLERFWRVQSVFRNDREYIKGDASRYVIDFDNDTVITGPDWTYFFFGDQLWFFPLDTGQGVSLTYTYLPDEYEDLGDSDEITWPQGHDLVLVLEAAAFLMAKGGTEDPSPLILMAERAKGRMYSALKKRWRGAVAVKGDSMFDVREFGGTG
jgi:hypothetical protein